jgi:peptidoglycan hydrolase-like protein with peptidoglycan-binding domain
MSDPTIKLGATGEAVKKAQNELIRRYYLAPDSKNGVFDDETHKAVIRYQLDRSAGEFYSFNLPLRVDGEVGPRTWARLAPAVVEKDMRDDDGVRLLQSILTSMGGLFDPNGIDGDFGDDTDKAVRKFQGKFSDYEGIPLTVDGDVGPITWRALWS